MRVEPGVRRPGRGWGGRCRTNAPRSSEVPQGVGWDLPAPCRWHSRHDQRLVPRLTQEPVHKHGGAGEVVRAPGEALVHTEPARRRGVTTAGRRAGALPGARPSCPAGSGPARAQGPVLPSRGGGRRGPGRTCTPSRGHSGRPPAPSSPRISLVTLQLRRPGRAFWGHCSCFSAPGLQSSGLGASRSAPTPTPGA